MDLTGRKKILFRLLVVGLIYGQLNVLPANALAPYPLSGNNPPASNTEKSRTSALSDMKLMSVAHAVGKHCLIRGRSVRAVPRMIRDKFSRDPSFYQGIDLSASDTFSINDRVVSIKYKNPSGEALRSINIIPRELIQEGDNRWAIFKEFGIKEIDAKSPDSDAVIVEKKECSITYLDKQGILAKEYVRDALQEALKYFEVCKEIALDISSPEPKIILANVETVSKDGKKEKYSIRVVSTAAPVGSYTREGGQVFYLPGSIKTINYKGWAIQIHRLKEAETGTVKPEVPGGSFGELAGVFGKEAIDALVRSSEEKIVFFKASFNWNGFSYQSIVPAYEYEYKDGVIRFTVIGADHNGVGGREVSVEEKVKTKKEATNYPVNGVFRGTINKCLDDKEGFIRIDPPVTDAQIIEYCSAKGVAGDMFENNIIADCNLLLGKFTAISNKDKPLVLHDSLIALYKKMGIGIPENATIGQVAQLIAKRPSGTSPSPIERIKSIRNALEAADTASAETLKGYLAETWGIYKKASYDSQEAYMGRSLAVDVACLLSKLYPDAAKNEVVLEVFNTLIKRGMERVSWQRDSYVGIHEGFLKSITGLSHLFDKDCINKLIEISDDKMLFFLVSVFGNNFSYKGVPSKVTVHKESWRWDHDGTDEFMGEYDLKYVAETGEPASGSFRGTIVERIDGPHGYVRLDPPESGNINIDELAVILTRLSDIVIKDKPLVLHDDLKALYRKRGIEIPENATLSGILDLIIPKAGPAECLRTIYYSSKLKDKKDISLEGDLGPELLKDGKGAAYFAAVSKEVQTLKELGIIMEGTRSGTYQLRGQICRLSPPAFENFITRFAEILTLLKDNILEARARTMEALLENMRYDEIQIRDISVLGVPFGIEELLDELSRIRSKGSLPFLFRYITYTEEMAVKLRELSHAAMAKNFWTWNGYYCAFGRNLEGSQKNEMRSFISEAACLAAELDPVGSISNGDLIKTLICGIDKVSYLYEELPRYSKFMFHCIEALGLIFRKDAINKLIEISDEKLAIFLVSASGDGISCRFLPSRSGWNKAVPLYNHEGDYVRDHIYSAYFKGEFKAFAKGTLRGTISHAIDSKEGFIRLDGPVTEEQINDYCASKSIARDRFEDFIVSDCTTIVEKFASIANKDKSLVLHDDLKALYRKRGIDIPESVTIGTVATLIKPESSLGRPLTYPNAVSKVLKILGVENSDHLTENDILRVVLFLNNEDQDIRRAARSIFTYAVSRRSDCITPKIKEMLEKEVLVPDASICVHSALYAIDSQRKASLQFIKSGVEPRDYIKNHGLQAYETIHGNADTAFETIDSLSGLLEPESIDFLIGHHTNKKHLVYFTLSVEKDNKLSFSAMPAMFKSEKSGYWTVETNHIDNGITTRDIDDPEEVYQPVVLVDKRGVFRGTISGKLGSLGQQADGFIRIDPPIAEQDRKAYCARKGIDEKDIDGSILADCTAIIEKFASIANKDKPLVLHDDLKALYKKRGIGIQENITLGQLIKLIKESSDARNIMMQNIASDLSINASKSKDETAVFVVSADDSGGISDFASNPVKVDAEVFYDADLHQHLSVSVTYGETELKKSGRIEFDSSFRGSMSDSSILKEGFIRLDFPVSAKAYCAKKKISEARYEDRVMEDYIAILKALSAIINNEKSVILNDEVRAKLASRGTEIPETITLGSVVSLMERKDTKKPLPATVDLSIPDDAVKKEFKVVPRLGIHGRVASRIIKALRQFPDAELYILKGNKKADGRSISQLMLLGASCGTKLTVYATGKDKERALEAVLDVLENEEKSASSQGDNPTAEAELRLTVERIESDMRQVNSVDLNMPTYREDGKILTHIISEELVPANILSDFKAMASRLELEYPEFGERIEVLKVSEISARAAAITKDGGKVDVAMSDFWYLNSVPKSVKVLVFEPDRAPGALDFVQLEGIIAALRALERRDSAALLKIYSILAKTEFTGKISDISKIIEEGDWKGVARAIPFKLRPTEVYDLKELKKLNDRLIDFIKYA